MAFAALWARMSFRHRWRNLVGTAVLVGVIGGLSLTSLAGARRTLSAYPRFLRSTNPSTLAVIAGNLQDPEAAALLDRTAQLPQVLEARAYVSFDTAFMVAGKPDVARPFEALGSIDGRYFVQDRFTPTAGRMPNPARDDEIAINREAARRYGLDVGDRVDVGVFTDDQVRDPAFGHRPTPPKLRRSATIVGVGLFIQEVVQDDTDRSALVLFTPAFVREARPWQTYAWQGLVLRAGDRDIPAVKSEFRSMTGPDYPQFFRVTSIDTFHAQQATRPGSIALAVFGAIAGLVAILLASQALGRHLHAERGDRAVNRALGASPRASSLASSIGPAVAVVTGVGVALVIAVATSPAMPIGTMRRVEIHRGIDIDWTVLGIGSAVLIASLFLAIAVLAWREEPNRVLHRVAPRRERPIVAATTSILPIHVTTGLRLAFQRGDGASAVPVRSVISGTIVAVAAVVAAVTFGASLTNLVDHPRLFGWDWDIALVDQQGYGNTKPGPTRQILGRDPDIQAWGGAFVGSDQIDGRNVPVLGMPADSPVTPPLRHGRTIQSDAEIVLGDATLKQLHKRVGDTVKIGTGRTLRIVGTATFPTIGIVHGDHTSLGIGALVESTRVPGYDRNITATGEYGPNIVFVRFRPGADRATATKRVRDAANQIGDYPGALDVMPVQRPAEIVNANDISSSPTLLSVVVAVSALCALVLGWTAAVRGRRRDLALLKVLGFTRGQLSATVAWQATATVLLSLAIGVPAGAALGRALWGLFAQQLDVLAQPAIPRAAIGSIVVATIMLANVVSAIPARAARAVPVALVLRTT
jgi:hypothetical protein